MGWGAMWMDVEFYNRLSFYKIPFSRWYFKPESNDTAIIDLSKSGISLEKCSLDCWTQGRDDLTLNDVPKVFPVDHPDSDIQFSPYTENYWYSDITTAAHINLTNLLESAEPRARDYYYRNSGYRRVNMKAVKKEMDNGINYFKYNTYEVMSSMEQHNEVVFPVSKRILENSFNLLDKEYQLINDNIVKLEFV